MAIRVMRLMEYIYPDIETAEKDMRRWFVQGTYYPGGSGNENRSITSTTILQPTDFEIVQVRESNEPE